MNCVIESGYGNRDNLRQAIQSTAKYAETKTIYGTTGWWETATGWQFCMPGNSNTEVELTEDDVITRMREMAANRFNIDKCDQAVVKLDLDWQHMPETVEYSQYSALKNAMPGDWVEVVNGPLGINELIRMTGYTWDPILEQFKGATFGDNKTTPSVAQMPPQMPLYLWPMKVAVLTAMTPGVHWPMAK